MKRNATAVWNGSGKEGSGNITTYSGVLKQVPYSHRTRFTDVEGTSPEELIAAAHAACFSLKLSFTIGAKNFTAEEIKTTAEVSVESGTISESHLTVSVKVPGMSNEDFQAAAAEAKENCPVSKALNMKITMEAKLV